MILNVNNQNIFFRERTSPSAKGSILFVHGNSVNSDVWEKQFTSNVFTEYNLYAIDLPGHGKSSHAMDSMNEYTIIGYANTLSEFVKTISLRNFIIVGFSLGGHLAIEALENIPGCKGLVLTGATPENFPPDFLTMFQPNPSVNTAFKAEHSEEERKEFVLSAFKPKTNLGINPFIEMVKQTDPIARECVAAGIAVGKMKNEIDILNSTKFPVCYIHGQEEQLINLEYLETLAVPKWKNIIHMVPDGGHLCFYENPEVFNVILKKYCEEVMPYASVLSNKIKG